MHSRGKHDANSKPQKFLIMRNTWTNLCNTRRHHRDCTFSNWRNLMAERYLHRAGKEPYRQKLNPIARIFCRYFQ